MQTVYEAVGRDEGLLRLAEAWHSRVMEDEVVSLTSVYRMGANSKPFDDFDVDLAVAISHEVALNESLNYSAPALDSSRGRTRRPSR